ncbi:MAG: acyl carrier protein [Chitinophagales bacterium]
MNEQTIKDTVISLLLNIAPDADAASMTDETNFRTDLGMDSFDFLQLMTAVSEKFELDIPEQDYTHVLTLKSLTGYILAKKA